MEKFLIVVPCYNEESRFPLSDFESYITNSENSHIHFLFVNDGSKDKTSSILSDFSSNHDHAHFLNLNENVGKSEAIRRGVLSQSAEKFSYIGYFDADLAAPLSQVNLLIEKSTTHKSPYLVMGTRISLLGSTQINRNKSRHYIGRVFATVVSNMLKLPVYDTQCGAKLIRKDVAAIIFKDCFISKWLFDVELLFRIKQNFENLNNKIIEMPLEKWEDKAGSKISFSYFFKAPIDLIKIYFKYK